MKKNLMTVAVLALVLVNLVLTVILAITILPETKKANELITQVCSAISLELKSDSVTSHTVSVPLDKVATYNIPDLTVNLKESGDGKAHYATFSILLSMDTENDDYKEYGEAEKMTEREDLIKSEINAVVSEFTYEEFTTNQQGVQDAILESLQRMYDSDFIVSVGFPTVTSQ